MKITLKDYRPFLHAEIVIGPGVTAIVGSSDAGKSCVVRAIRDAAFGARGTSCVRKGAAQAEIALDVGGGRVEYRKGAKVNRYKVVAKGKTPVEFAGQGAKTPVEVGAAIGFLDIEPDAGISLRPNLAMQHDPPFLLAETPSVVAKIVGASSGLNIVLASVREAQADVARLNKEVGEAEAKAVVLDASASEAGNAQKILALALRTVDDAAARCGIAEAAESIARRISDELRSAATRVVGWRNSIANLPDVPALSARIGEAERIRGVAVKAWACIAAIKRAEEAYSRAELAVDAAEGVDADVMSLHVADAAQLLLAAAHGRSLSSRKVDLTSRVKSADAWVCENGYEVVRLEAEIATYSSCPLCNQPLHEEAKA